MNGGTLIQGGRLRKTNRGIISFAPFLAGASMLALGALLTTTPPAGAGTCNTATPSTDTKRICSGAADESSDRGITFEMVGQMGHTTSVRFTDDGMPFGLSVDNDGGIRILSNADSVTVGISLQGDGDITVGGPDNRPNNLFSQNGDAIYVNHAGTGDIDINVRGNLQSTQGSGVQIRSEEASHMANTNVTITGNIGAAGTNDANAVGKDGVYIFQNKGGSATVQVTGNIWAGKEMSFDRDRQGGETGVSGSGIYIKQIDAQGQNAQVTVTGDIRARGHGIYVYNDGIGTTWVKALEGDVTSFGNGKGIYARTHANSGGNYNAYIAAKTVTASGGKAVELLHEGGGTGRIAITGSAISETDEGIMLTAKARQSEITPDVAATHLSVKVGTEARRNSGAASADVVRSAKNGITIEHNGRPDLMGNARATADVRSYAYITATNNTMGTEATGVKITMGKDTTNANIMQEDGTGTEGATTTEIQGVTVRVLAHEEINAKTHGIHVSQGGTGNVLIVSSCSTDTVTMADSCITAAEGYGIRVDDGARISATDGGDPPSGHEDDMTGSGTVGDIDITVNGEADRGGTTGTNRAIKSAGTGIFLHQVGDGDADVTVNGSIEATVGHGIEIDRDAGGGHATVTVNADITAGRQGNEGGSAINIHFIHDANQATARTTTGNIDVTIAEGVTLTGDSAPVIDVGNFGSGDVTITLNGAVRRTGSTGTLIGADVGSSGTLTLVLGDGADMSGSGAVNRDIVSIASSSSTAILRLTGTSESKTFDLGEISGFDNLEKTGSGTWTLTGAQGDANSSEYAFNQLTVSSGTLVLNLDAPSASGTPNLNFTGDNPVLSIGSGATVDISQQVSTTEGVTLDLDGNLNLNADLDWNGNLNLDGSLILSGADRRIDVGGLVAGTGASVTLDIAFPEVMEEETDEMDGTGEADEMEEERVELANARLDTGTGDANAAGSIVVNIVPIGDNAPVSLGNLIRVGGTASMGEDTFVAGNAIDSPIRFKLEHEELEGDNVWDLVIERAAAEAGGRGTIHDALTAVLSQLSHLETLHERLRDRKAKYGTSSWVKTYAGNTEVTPSAPSFDIEQAGFEMGLRAPLQNVFDQNWAKSVSLDASIEFARAFTDVLVEAGMADIQSNIFALAVGTTYNRDGLYIDGQLRYAQFENNLDDENMRLASPGANSLSAGIEIGHVLGGDISLGEFMGGTSAPDDAGSPNVKLIPSAQLFWSSVDFDPYTSTTGINVRLNDGDALFGRIGALAEGEWQSVHFLHESFPAADVRLRGHLNVLMPLDGEVVTEVMGLPMSSERIEPALDAGVGFIYEWDDAYALHAGFSTQQGEEVEGYTGNIGFKHEF
ncbi:MAG: autotransporter outer membrane beta-barrel domain-containing protein [Hyphomicrobiales bacterium]|nr:autotransporter outer membrane beta-barrel domain-containing protein [Hyphomicrobiales bacterium]